MKSRARGLVMLLVLAGVGMAGASAAAILPQVGAAGKPEAAETAPETADDAVEQAGPGTAAAAPASAEEASLPARLAARRKAVADDELLEPEKRKILDTTLAQLLAIARAVDDVAARLDAGTRPGDALDQASHAREDWRETLPAEASPAEAWLHLGYIDEELHSLYQRERALFSLSTADAAQTLGFEPLLTQAVPLSELALKLPVESVHSAAVLLLARELELERARVFSTAASARRRDVFDHLERAGRLRADVVASIAAALKTRERIEADMIHRVAARLAQVRTAVARYADTADPRVASAIAEVSTLADETARQLDTVSAVGKATRRHERALTEISRRFASTRGRLAVAGASEAIGLALISELAATLPPGRIAKELVTVRRDLADTRLRLLQQRARLADEYDPLPALETPDVLTRAAQGGEDDPRLVEALRYRMLSGTEAATLAIGGMLGRQELVLAELERLNRELRQLIGSRLVWTRSHGPIGLDWAKHAVRRAGEGHFGARLVRNLRAIPASLPAWMPRLPLTLAGVLTLLLLWRWIMVLHAKWTKSIAAGGLQSLAQIFKVLAATVLLAIPWTLLVGALFRVMRGFDPPSGFLEWVVHGVAQSLGNVLVLLTLAMLSRPNGVSRLALGWSAELCRRIRLVSIALLVLLLPGHMAVASAWYRGDLEDLEYGTRALFILAWLGVAVVTWWGLRPLATDVGMAAVRSGRLRIVLRLGLTFAAVLAAVCSAAGQLIAAAALAQEVYGTLVALSVLLVANSIFAQGIALGEKRAAEWREVAAALARKERSEGEAAVEPEAEAEALKDVAAGGTDTRRLVEMALLFIGAIWVLAIWSDLLPVLGHLDELSLWRVAVPGAEAGTFEAVTMLDLLLAIVAGMVAAASLQRVPGTIDLFVRQRSTVDAGLRYAIATVTRYAIAVAGVVVTLGLLGMHWENLQWMAAALTVGLGFGLQEIFANFVSGLILLFERPVRVGDVVTVGDLTGTVSKIGTRATTILDFDRREIMIPNKALITDRLVNWTLTNETTRVTVKVGVGYGTDPALVHRLLRQAAEETPGILAKPAPLTVFVAIGASNLEFELRACVGHFDDRVPASNALHAKVMSLFNAAGIGIDYEQLDVRVLQVPPIPVVAPPADSGSPPARGSSSPASSAPVAQGT